MDWASIDRIASGYSDAVVEMTERFISVPTENPPGRHYADFIAELTPELDRLSIGYEIISIPGGGDLPRYAVIAEAGRGPTSFQLHGHYDVVPAFSPDQFSPRRHQGALWGRGASDMKGGLAAAIAAAAAVRDLGLGKVRLVIVPDEETGGELGAAWLARKGLLTTPDVQATVVCEPTWGLIWHACRGALSMRVDVLGKASHVGLHYAGENAFEAMLPVARRLVELERKVSTRWTELNIQPEEARESILLLGGQVDGGVNFNVVPDRASFTIDRRFNPEESREAVLGEITGILDDARLEGVEVSWDMIQDQPSAHVPTDSVFARSLSRQVAEVTGCSPSFEMCPGLLETRFYAQLRVPALAFGPGPIANMHGPDEHVPVANLEAAVRIYARTAIEVLAQA